MISIEVSEEISLSELIESTLLSLSDLVSSDEDFDSLALGVESFEEVGVEDGVVELTGALSLLLDALDELFGPQDVNANNVLNNIKDLYFFMLKAPYLYQK